MKNFLINVLFGGRGTFTKLGDFGLAVLRIGIGLLIALGHGGSKVYHGGTFGLPPQFVGGVASLGFPHPEFFAWCSALSELLLTFNMCVAAFGYQLHMPIVAGPGVPSKELALLYLLPTFCILMVGAGRISVDRIIRGA
jgi:putative oxidoreductase